MDNGEWGSVEVVIVISSVISAIVIVVVGIVQLWGTALFFMVLVFPVPGSFGSAALLGRLFSFLGVSGLFLLSWSHKDFLVNGDRRFGLQDMRRDVVLRKERYLFYFLGGSGDGAEEYAEDDNNEDSDD